MRNDAFEIDVDASASGIYPALNPPTLPAISFENIYGFSIIVSSLAGQTGTLTIQVSNDQLNTLLSGSGTWASLPSGALTIAGAAIQVGNFDATFYKWLRINYTRTGGAGTIQAFFCLKGP